MKVINANEGPKIPYDVSGNKITFDDEIMLNLEKKEADADVNIDISTDDFGGLITGIGRDYVAQIDIPARVYEEIPAEGEEMPEAGNPMQTEIPGKSAAEWAHPAAELTASPSRFQWTMLH